MKNTTSCFDGNPSWFMFHQYDPRYPDLWQWWVIRWPAFVLDGRKVLVMPEREKLFWITDPYVFAAAYDISGGKIDDVPLRLFLFRLDREFYNKYHFLF